MENLHERGRIVRILVPSRCLISTYTGGRGKGSHAVFSLLLFVSGPKRAADTWTLHVPRGDPVWMAQGHIYGTKQENSGLSGSVVLEIQ